MNKVEFVELFFIIIFYAYIFFYCQCLSELGHAGLEV